MTPFEFFVHRRPVSHQAKSASHRREWIQFVHGRAYQTWRGLPISGEKLRFTLVYLCGWDPPDINNIIKPVQDALVGLVYADDRDIVDVRGHLRMLGDPILTLGLPPPLRDAARDAVECVYVRIDSSIELVDQL